MLSTGQKDFKQQMTEARREQILLGAAQVFSAKGFHKATTRAIAKAAGVSEGTIYNYFENKRELLLAMIELIGVQSLRSLVQNQDQIEPKTFLTMVMTNRFQLLHERGHIMAPLLAEVFTDLELRQAIYQRVVRPVISYVESYVKSKMEAGLFRPLNPVIVARAVVGATMMNAIFKVSQLDSRYDTISSQVMIEEIVTLIVDGLSSEARSDTPATTTLNTTFDG
jgi:AcrR family transcriptional regulator